MEMRERGYWYRRRGADRIAGYPVASLSNKIMRKTWQILLDEEIDIPLDIYQAWPTSQFSAF